MHLEVCIDSVESAIAAQRGGTHRVELCSALSEGGLTPGAGLIATVRRNLAIDLFVMIRPRGGDFCYSALEFEVMQQEISHARNLGADGVVLGILDEEGLVDIARTSQLVQLAAPLPVTFHRAIDMTPDLSAALDAVLETGATRILTSGGAPNATAGCAEIARLVQSAKGCIAIMPGGGVSIASVAAIAIATGATEFLASVRSAFPSPVNFRKQGIVMGDTPDREYRRSIVREDDVRALVGELERLAAERAAAQCGSTRA